MNKRDKEQLRASIARDLIQGQGGNSPTRELLRQYAPLEGIINTTSPHEPFRSSHPEPVENTMARGATVAWNEESPWNGATVARDARVAPEPTLARYAMVKGELRVPNTINFSIFPTLDPFAKAVYYQLFLLSHGFKRDTCLISLARLARVVLMSQRKVQNTIADLEKRGLIKKLEAKLGGPSRGILFRMPLPAAEAAPESTTAHSATQAGGTTHAPHATLARHATVAPYATNKEKLDDDLKIKSSSKAEKSAIAIEPVENHGRAASPPERGKDSDEHLALVRAAYERATGNRWNKSDFEAYAQNHLRTIPAEKIVSALEAVSNRTPAKINSFRYFVRELVRTDNPRSRAWHRKQLERIVRRIRDNAIGRDDYSTSDFVEDVKRACAREAVPFDNDIFNELAR